MKIESTSFDILKFSKAVGRDRTLSIIYKSILTKMNIMDGFVIDPAKLHVFLYKITKGYNKEILYHNDLHACDVAQTVYSWFSKVNILQKLHLNDLDMFAFLTACIIHDFKHPGLTNGYHTNTLSEIAVRYNDKSVLENMHLSEAFIVLLDPLSNIFEHIENDEFKIIRKRMIESVLATDMSQHFKITSIVKAKTEYLEIRHGSNVEKLVTLDVKNLFEEQQDMMNFIIHLADISHNTKEWSISKTWTDCLYEEFFRQGDKEKNSNLPTSMFCDRKSTNIPKSQIGFIKGIVYPTFELLCHIFPDLDYTTENCDGNADKWQELLNE